MKQDKRRDGLLSFFLFFFFPNRLKLFLQTNRRCWQQVKCSGSSHWPDVSAIDRPFHLGLYPSVVQNITESVTYLQRSTANPLTFWSCTHFLNLLLCHLDINYFEFLGGYEWKSEVTAHYINIMMFVHKSVAATDTGATINYKNFSVTITVASFLTFSLLLYLSHIISCSDISLR